VPRSTSKSSATTEPAPSFRPLDAGAGAALSVDVEEWYHNCWIPEYVDPARRGRQVEELDRLLPALLERLARLGARATFFVLGEVARRLPGEVRAIADAGHEVACHGELHLRANDLSPARFRADLAAVKARLEDLVGREIAGYRAPEWSLRSASNPRLRIVADCGFRYDSSLAPSPGAGDRSNPREPGRWSWPDGATVVEVPPLVWGGPLRLPAGGWCGRTAPAGLLRRAVRRAEARGELPLLVVHPWELVERPCPGLMTGFARFFHDAGRDGYAARFDALVSALDCRRTLMERCAALLAAESRAGAGSAATTVEGFDRRAAELAS
jgi:peptidoglycan/xylan/chitin deacetylase (PgdA/CDA1 family)